MVEQLQGADLVHDLEELGGGHHVVKAEVATGLTGAGDAVGGPDFGGLGVVESVAPPFGSDGLAVRHKIGVTVVRDLPVGRDAPSADVDELVAVAQGILAHGRGGRGADEVQLGVVRGVRIVSEERDGRAVPEARKVAVKELCDARHGIARSAADEKDTADAVRIDGKHTESDAGAETRLSVDFGIFDVVGGEEVADLDVQGGVVTARGSIIKNYHAECPPYGRVVFHESVNVPLLGRDRIAFGRDDNYRRLLHKYPSS